MHTAIEQEQASLPVDRAPIGVLESLRAALPSLSARSRQVAGFVLSHPDRIVGMSAARIARETNTSVGTVVRLCHAVGLPGIQDLKLRVIAELGLGRIVDSVPTDSQGSATLARIIEDLCRTAAALDHDLIERLAAALGGANRVLLVSSGTSQPLAIEFGNWLSSQGRAVSYPTDSGTQAAVSSQLGTSDICFAISHSGVTEATLAPMRAAAANGARTVALTSYSRAPLARLADIAIVAGAAADGARSEEMASRMVHHAVLQVLRTLLSLSHRTPSPKE